MPKVVVIADDLTGANATGVLLARKGFQVATYLNLNDLTNRNKHLDVISITTNSRGLKKEEAYKLVADTTSHFKSMDIKFFSKRIDSTLRGNIGAEIDGVLTTLKGDEVAIVVASYPTSGRISAGGYLLVNSIPLEKTDVAKDPKTPVSTSCILEVIKGQTKTTVGYIPLKEVLKGSDSLKEGILEEKAKGSKIIVIDATTDEEIEVIAKAVAKSQLSVIAVDPGPFTAMLAKHLVGEDVSGIPGKKAFFAVGSVTQQTKRQLEELKLKHNPHIVKVNPEMLLDIALREKEINRAVEEIMEKIDGFKVIGVTTNGSKILNLKEVSAAINISEDDAAQRISNGLGKITAKVMEASKGLIGGLYTSGGDVTVEVCSELNSSGIEVKDEVLPLAAYGRVINGAYDNTPVITKGGLVGNDMAMVECIDYLLTKISNEYYNLK
ncbi:four-carbon acid sugar kinase family protein [Alkaliphilus transvaalensis]|uniref:four-carbon acid sugar kinase family protein n=1 Tax=Alkaliphilus transvaalensis TaxID=114628 RepID=UPI00047D58DD|nr:four-carbon acid sugar kinase family protein [Alkaliphilus transvaalensis]